jgi:hypothetical protein
MCPLCGMTSVYTQHINRRCAKTWEEEGVEEPVRCEGHFKAAVSPRDWLACPQCRATGYQGEEGWCGRCDGAGWTYVGPPLTST